MKSRNAGKGEVRELSGSCEHSEAWGRKMNSAVFRVRGKQVREASGLAVCSHDISIGNFLVAWGEERWDNTDYIIDSKGGKRFGQMG